MNGSPRLLVVMGVTSCGKSTVGRKIADALEARYIEGDDLHPQANVDKMSAGKPLTDDDRWPWLDILGRKMADSNGTVVASCSSLKRAYRFRITVMAGDPVVFVYLQGSRDLIAKRMAARKNHFMPQSLLDSQFAALEEPGEDELHITVSIDQDEDAVVASALEGLRPA